MKNIHIISTYIALIIRIFVWLQWYFNIKNINSIWFTDCIHYKVWWNYTWWDTGKILVYQAWDNVCYRINKNWIQDIYIAE